MSVFDDAIADGLAAARGRVEGALAAKDEALATAAAQLQHRTDELHAALEAAKTIQFEKEEVEGERSELREDLKNCAAHQATLRAQTEAATAEAARVTALLDSTAEQLEVVTADRDLIASALASSEDDLKAAQSALVESDKAIAARNTIIELRERTIVDHEKVIGELRARIAELEQGGVVDPPRARTLLGGTPWSGYASVSSRDSTLTRWGDGVAVRLFNKEANTLIPAPPRGNAGALVVSWKPTSLAVITDDNVRAALANLQPGDMHGIWHEPDVKVRDEIKANGQAAGDRLAAFYKELAWAWYQAAKRVRPDLDVFACGSAWTWDPSTSFDPADYWEPRAFDVFAADYDGLAGPKDYRPVTPHLQAWLRSVDRLRYLLAEYGVKTRAASGSTPAFTNAMRPAWLVEQTTALLEDPWPPEIICLYENDTSDEGRKYNLTTQPEKSTWDDLIGTR